MSKLCSRINSILKDLQAGKLAKRNELIETTYNYLKSVAYKYATDKNDCEDIVQEAYLRAFKYIHTADLEQDGYNWLCKIVQNVAYDFSKRPQTLAYEEAYFVGDMDETLIENDLLHTELKRFPKADRRLFYLRYWGDMTYREIASKLNISKSLVHKRIHEIEKILEKNLK